MWLDGAKYAYTSQIARAATTSNNGPRALGGVLVVYTTAPHESDVAWWRRAITRARPSRRQQEPSPKVSGKEVLLSNRTFYRRLPHLWCPVRRTGECRAFPSSSRALVPSASRGVLHSGVEQRRSGSSAYRGRAAFDRTGSACSRLSSLPGDVRDPRRPRRSVHTGSSQSVRFRAR